jgi:hypothetical protein
VAATRKALASSISPTPRTRPHGATGRVDRAKASAAGVDAIKRSKAAAYADLAPMIADLAAQGLSLRAIAARLNEQGEVTRRGLRWAAVQVMRILNGAA